MMKKIFTSDVDIDLANRDQLLSLIKHIPATIKDKNGIRKHNTGVYITDIPYDASRRISSINYIEAEARGYVKLDLLNVNTYLSIKSESHLVDMMVEPDWKILKNRKIVEQIIHINKHFDTLQRMPEPVDSIPRMAMFLAIIRPGKRHLIGKTWKEIAETVWEASEEGFIFKKSHSVAYAHLVVVSMNLLADT